MLITRRMDYGVRIMMALGLHAGERLSGQALADEAEVSRDFALKIVRQLADAGLVRTRRGVGGGVELARDAERISLLDVFRATDSPRALNECLLEPEVCGRSRRCAAHRLLLPIQERLDRALATVTLADLVREQRTLDAGDAP